MEDRRYEKKTLSGNREEKKPYSIRIFLLDLFRFLFLLFGLFGIISVIHGFPGLEFDQGKLFLYGGLTLFLLFALYRLNALAFAILSSLSIIILARRIYLAWPLILEQSNHVYNWFMAIEQSPGDLTDLFLYGVLILAFFIFHLDIVARLHLPTYIIITAIFLLPPLFGSDLGLRDMLLLGASQFFFIADVKTARGLKSGFQNSGKRSLIAFKSSIAAVILFCIALLIAMPLSNRYEGEIYEKSLAIEERLEDALDMAFSNDEGLINRGSNFHSGETVFTAVMEREPADSIYLTRYRGASYDGSRWSAVDEEDFLSQISSAYEIDMSEVRSLFNTLYFQWNYVGVSGVDGNVRQLALLSPETKYVAMRPYNAIRPESATQDEAGINRALYYYYEGREIAELPDDAEKGWSGMAGFANQYGEYAYSNYTSYPERQLPNLKALVDATPLEDLNEITSFIVYTLGTNAKYTVKPGMAPFNRDIVEHFLFNSGLGYCQHYASTAALMYRMYGIPARYVTGFRLDPEDFDLRSAQEAEGTYFTQEFVSGENGDASDGGDSSEGGDGGDSSGGEDAEGAGGSESEGDAQGEPLLHYVSDVPDSAAHAWVEIYIKGYGWVPVDVTPSSSGRFYPKYPGFDYSVMSSIQEAHGWVLNPEESVVEEESSPLLPEIPEAEVQPTVEEETFEEDLPPQQQTPSIDENQGQAPSPFPDLIDDMEMADDPAPTQTAPTQQRSEVLKEVWSFIKKLFYLALVVGALFAGFLLYRRINLRRNETSDVKALFQRLISMLEYSGLALPKRMDSPELPALISEYLKGEEGYTPISTEQASAIQRIVTEATFSPRPASKEDRDFVQSLYNDAAEKLYDEQTWFKKLMFKYIRVYL